MPESPWEEFEDSQGKKYWHNKNTRRTQWEKPEELKTAAEKEADSNPWKEFTSDNGKKYYHNSKTKESRWDMPEEYRQYLRKLEAAKDPKESFKQLMLDRGMTVNWTFEQVLSETKDDERAKSLKISDRKQLFQDLLSELKKREAEEKRRKQEQIAKEFFDLMDSHPNIDDYTSFRFVSFKHRTRKARFLISDAYQRGYGSCCE